MTMLWLLLPILFGLLFAEQRNRRYQQLLVQHPPEATFSWLRLLPDAFVLAALTLILLTLQPSRPVTHGHAPGPSIALVVDVSTSMGVADQKPSRLAKAKHELLALIDHLPAAHFTLIPFAGEAVLQVPLTGDRDGLRFFINNLHTGLISSLGSAPEEAVLLAQKTLSGVSGERLIILLTDGERTIAEQPAKLSASIPVYCIQTGTTAGGQVGRNRAAISLADPERLADIAHQTGGRLLEETTVTPAVFDLPLANSLSEAVNPPTTQTTLAVALFLLLLRWVPTIVAINRTVPVSLLLLVMLLPGCELGDGSIHPRTHYNNGLQAALNKDLDGALAAFTSAAKTLDGQQRGAAHYNLATLLLEAGQTEDAIELFERALVLIPGDEAIRDNLLLALAEQNIGLSDGKSKAEHKDSGEGEEMSPQQAQRLINSVQLDPAAPPTEGSVRQPTVLKEW